MRSSLLIAVLLGLVAFSLGDVAVPCPTDKECIKVGFTYAGTGSLAPEGVFHYNGTVLWANRVNSLGGINTTSGTYYIELHAYNDKSNSTYTRIVYTTLVTTDNVDYLLGPYGTSYSEVAASIAQQYRKVLILGNCAADAAYPGTNDLVFGVVSTTTRYAETLFDYLSTLDLGAESTVAIAQNPGLDFTVGTTTGAISYMNNYGFTLAGPVVNFTSTDNETVLEQKLKTIASYKADIFLSIGLLQDGFNILQAARDIKFQPLAFWMTSAPSTEEFVLQIGDEANYLMGPTQWDVSLNYRGDNFGNASQYYTAYKNEFGQEPSFIAASASAAGLALSEALALTPNITDPNSVAATLRTLNITTFYGPIAFDSKGRNNVKPMFLTQVLDEVIHIVYPKAQSTAKPVYPIPYAAQTTGQSDASSNVLCLTFVLLLSALAMIL
eukprot:TRINITY_DN1455_c0_g1_i1.p1 TRINITY_DN1455_c0_g1~~TRINITY_DN1455_c0_g1_i1.p1  ORF type:complete len:439 (+),score=104.51 TRINITY_DN1455_c0_g1_i1:196-1512(+)